MISSPAYWSPLRIYGYYRLLLSCLLIGLYFLWFDERQPSNIKSPAIYLATSLLYLAICISTMTFLAIRKSEGLLLKFFVAAIDIITITLLAHTSGGLNSNLSILLVVCVAAGSTMIPGRAGTALAAIATIAVLFEQFYFNLVYDSNSNFSATGLLGISFFAVSIFCQTISRRLGESELAVIRTTSDLEEWQSLNEYIIERMQAGILVVESSNTIKIINKSAKTLLALSPGAACTNLNEVCPQIDKKLMLWRNEDNEANTPFRAREDGPLISCSFTLLSTDIHKHILIFLDDASTLAQQAQHLKLASLARLTAGIAHEIRNPLGAISHAAQLLLESEHLSKDDARLADIVQHHCVRVNNIIENVLYLSRRKKPITKTFELNDWVRNFTENFQPNQKTCSILNSFGPECIVKIDPNHLYQVLTNLVENGLRYSERNIGEAVVEIITDLDSNTQRPFMEIQDRGVGIDESQQTYLFEPFFTTETSGTGMGLYISRELCEINQAQLLHVPSNKEGCCFRIIFPHPDKNTDL